MDLYSANIVESESQNTDVGADNMTNATFTRGVNELKEVVENIRLFGVPDKNFTVDLTIARGLDYYTGTVYETFLNDYREIGSVCSGGRYENLAENYTDRKLPGVGVSIGLTRLFYKLNELNLIKADKKCYNKVDELVKFCLNELKCIMINELYLLCLYLENSQDVIKHTFAKFHSSIKNGLEKSLIDLGGNRI